MINSLHRDPGIKFQLYAKLYKICSKIQHFSESLLVTDKSPLGSSTIHMNIPNKVAADTQASRLDDCLLY